MEAMFSKIVRSFKAMPGSKWLRSKVKVGDVLSVSTEDEDEIEISYFSIQLKVWSLKYLVYMIP